MAKSKLICSFDGCNKPSRTKHLCVAHYTRLLRYGSAYTVKRIARAGQSLIERFIEQYIPVTESGCWLWTGAKARGDYGVINKDNKLVRAHRVSYMLFKGKIPDGLMVLHKCDIPDCVNPEHLFLGTAMDNTHDMIKKGRQSVMKGENHYKSILNRDDIKIIRNSHKKVKELAEEYGVAPGTIYNVLQRKTWSHID